MQWKERAVAEIACLLRFAISDGRHTARLCALLVTAAGAVALILWIRGMAR
jgi:hypothetical protein